MQANAVLAALAANDSDAVESVGGRAAIEFIGVRAL